MKASITLRPRQVGLEVPLRPPSIWSACACCSRTDLCSWWTSLHHFALSETMVAMLLRLQHLLQLQQHRRLQQQQLAAVVLRWFTG